MQRKLSRRRRHIGLVIGLALALALIVVGTVVLWAPKVAPYRAGEPVEGLTRSLDRGLPADYPRVQFVEVSASAGIQFRHFPGTRSAQLPEDMGSGAAWGDFDGDGYYDLYVCNVAGPLTESSEVTESLGGNRLYRNNQDGTFIDVTDSAGVGLTATSMGAAWGDYDADGDEDLWVTSFGQNVLYRNNSDGTFTDVSQQAGLGALEGFWTGVSWADYDRDGDLDVYVCGYVQYEYDPNDAAKVTSQYQSVVPFTLNPSSYPPVRNLLFRNQGGRFQEIGVEAGLENAQGRSLSATWSDFDGDLWPDVYVANDISDNVLYLNQKDGSFLDVAHQAWVADYRGAMGLAVGDWDNDTDFDLFITHWIAQENALFNNLLFVLGERFDEDGQLHFFDVADQTGLGQISLPFIGWGTSFFDYDNDGREDLFVVNGSTFQQEQDPRLLIGMRDLLFWNRGDEEGFFEVGAVSGDFFNEERIGRGAAFADYDNDGDVDVFVVNHQGSGALLRNDGGNRNNWLKVRLRGGAANPQGLGARVELIAGELRLGRLLGAQSSYLSQNAPEASFGLGSFTHVDRVVVTFPDGSQQQVSGVNANQTLIIQKEPQ